ncbi:MAG: ATP-grasp domain-containing protein, partial [Gammaproteobacteria bacterium]|nr:ATP-grasp domain-containing protein [Gammaproteobacteria bacterium]
HLLHLSMAGDRVCIGERSYLDGGQLLAAATSRGCDAVHPGYGFLAENADFAEQVENRGLSFIGPSARHLRIMADKAEARRVMASHGVPILPGSEGPVSGLEEALRVADEVGYPVMLKAAHGGGGRGILIANSRAELNRGFNEITAASEVLFGKGDVYVERFLSAARHIEFQMVGDGVGKVIHFGARECSIQRHHQKLIEETPPPGIADRDIEEMASRCAAALAKEKYASLGTVEFLFQDGDFFFIEMNTRIQVEHPVTEEVAGADLLKLQLNLADKGQLDISQEDVELKGHALEVRINAEDENFSPSPGAVRHYLPPGGPGIRVDSHLYAGYEIPHQYDSLVAKVISRGRSREDAIRIMQRAVSEMRLEGVATNLPLHEKILADERFLSGEYDTSFLDRLN